MAKSVELLLTESVENLGIVGDVVKVRIGYARNFLLPRSLATVPSDELVKQLQAKRAEAQKQMAQLREERKGIISKLSGFELTLVRACNDLGVLYGAVTQQEIAKALKDGGFAVRPRDVRLSETIKRVGDYEVLVKYETELETKIRLHVKPDRELAKEEREEMDFDEEGNLITADNPGKFRKQRPGRPDRRDTAAMIDEALKAEKTDKGGDKWARPKKAEDAGAAAAAAPADDARGGEKKAAKKSKKAD